MARTGAVSGRGGSCVVAINSSTSVTLNITGWEGNLMKNFSDSTDSGNLDSVGQLWRSQVPGDVGLDGTLSGYFDSSGTTASLITAAIKSDGPYMTSLSVTSATLFAAWNLDFTNVKQTLQVPGATTVSFTADFKSNGPPATLTG